MTKLKLIRVVTDGRVVPWHLEKTIRDHCEHFDIIVVGENVTSFARVHESIRYIDLPITPKINILKDLWGLVQLVRILIAEKPLIIHSIMPKAGLLTALASFFLVPVRIHTFTGQIWQKKSGISRFLLVFLDKVVVSLNTICLTDSRSQSKFLSSEKITNADGSPLKCLLHGSLGGVDLEKIDISKKINWSNNVKARHSIPTNNVVIGYVARKTEDKGAFLFLRLCKIISQNFDNVSFLFVGPDDSQGAVEYFVKSDEILNGLLINVGQVENHEEYLASLDILCLPSFREGFGSIVIDAAALEVPTVGSSIPGLVDAIIHMETGIIFQPGDLEDLVASVDLLIKDRLLLTRLGKNARARVLDYFDSKVLSKELLDTYGECLAMSGK